GAAVLDGGAGADDYVVDLGDIAPILGQPGVTTVVHDSGQDSAVDSLTVNAAQGPNVFPIVVAGTQVSQGAASILYDSSIEVFHLNDPMGHLDIGAGASVLEGSVLAYD